MELAIAGLISIAFGIGIALGIFLARPRKLDGSLAVSSRDHTKIFQLEIDTEPEELQKKDRIVLKVKLRDDEVE